MSDYRDFGTIGDLGATDGSPNSLVNTTRRGQVYQVTHEAEGIRLPFMNRSFISFSFGGKPIEDFNLVVTTGDRMRRNGYSSFNATTTTPTGLDGQQLWGIHYGNNSLDLTLSTDGMDQRMLDEFLHWFSAGAIRELILSEHPNRATLARVGEPPQLEMLPFAHDIQMNISGSIYKTKTTLYKGDIMLKLVMDEPHWYSIENILGKKRDNRYVDLWDDANGNEVSIFASQDALKILYEDGIPLGSMIDNNMLLGNNTYASVEDNIISRIWDPDADEGLGAGAKIDSGDRLTGIIAGAIVDASGEGITSLTSSQNAHFFYAGTAPAPIEIIFTLQPILSNYYVTSPFNSYTTTKYNFIAIESETIQKLCFTTPNLLTSYNKTREIFANKLSDEYSWEDIRESIRNFVRHPHVRAWANKVLDYGEENNIKNSDLTKYLSYFLQSGGVLYPIKIRFNSETGDAVGTFTYRGVTSSLPQNDTEWNTYGTGENVLFSEVEEDVGDMLLTNHLLIIDRNYPTSNGRIVKWENTTAGRKYSHRLYHNVTMPLTNIMLIYKNMYL